MSANSDSGDFNHSKSNNELENKTESDLIRKETVDVNDIIYTSIYDTNNRSNESPLTNAFNHDLRVGFTLILEHFKNYII